MNEWTTYKAGFIDHEFKYDVVFVNYVLPVLHSFCS